VALTLPEGSNEKKNTAPLWPWQRRLRLSLSPRPASRGRSGQDGPKRFAPIPRLTADTSKLSAGDKKAIAKADRSGQRSSTCCSCASAGSGNEGPVGPRCKKDQTPLGKGRALNYFLAQQGPMVDPGRPSKLPARPKYRASAVPAKKPEAGNFYPEGVSKQALGKPGMNALPAIDKEQAQMVSSPPSAKKTPTASSRPLNTRRIQAGTAEGRRAAEAGRRRNRQTPR